MALRPARANEIFGECDLEKDGRLTFSDDGYLSFTGLNNPRYHPKRERVCPSKPRIDEVERIDRAALMVYVRCVETEKNPRGLVFKLEGYTLHIYKNENF
jgi:hypothetical protein